MGHGAGWSDAFAHGGVAISCVCVPGVSAEHPANLWSAGCGVDMAAKHPHEAQRPKLPQNTLARSRLAVPPPSAAGNVRGSRCVALASLIVTSRCCASRRASRNAVLPLRPCIPLSYRTISLLAAHTPQKVFFVLRPVNFVGHNGRLPADRPTPTSLRSLPGPASCLCWLPLVGRPHGFASVFVPYVRPPASTAKRIV